MSSSRASFFTVLAVAAAAVGSSQGAALAAPAPKAAPPAPKPTGLVGSQQAPTRPAVLPPVVSLSIAPDAVTLDGPMSRQQLVITGVRKDGTLVDLTGKVTISAARPGVVAVGKDGLVRPLADGEVTVIARRGALQATIPVKTQNTTRAFTWNFQNHVQSVLSKSGCNMGACHGAAAGKGGFRLTLRGYDSDLDYERLLRESGSRRIQKADPGNSLLLKKATLAVPHAGGLRFKPMSLDYKVLAQWIAAGMPGPSEHDPQLTRLEIYPSTRTLRVKDEQQLYVRAHFSDGHVEDVTHWARYASNEGGVAEVDESGRVKTVGPGETAIQVIYLGKVTFAQISIPFDNQVKEADYAGQPVNYIDQLVTAKLKTLRLAPSAPASDDEFLRRVYLDVTGRLPSADDVRAFLKDPDPQKRAKLIDRLLDSPEYVDFWTYKWGDLLRINRETLTDKGMWTMYQWLRDHISQNSPWDQIVYEVITANGSNFEYGPSNFYRISRTPEDLTETISQAFMGIRVSCAKCHNHPFEKWTQADYYKFANLLSRVNRKQGDLPQDLIITTAGGGEINFPKTGKPLPPAPYDGRPMADGVATDRRVYLAEWLTSPKNDYFVRSIVNRIWRNYMGRGLIEPVDDLRVTNPASNEPLMNALCKDLVAHRFDLKHLMRTILNSNTYQRTSRPREENKKDDRHYSRYFVRRLTAEQLLDAICQVTGQPEKFPGLPMGTRASQLPDTRVPNYFLDVFGRPPRQITCDCERAQEPNMAQALHLINGQGVNQKISAQGGTVDVLLKSGKKDAEIVEELYLTCFGRFPSADETKAALLTLDEALNPKPEAPKPAEAKPAETKPGEAKPAEMKPAEPPKIDPAVMRRQVFEDLLWALINGKEFVFNH